MNNAFNLLLVFAAVDLQYLSGAANNNLQFEDIDIQAGTLTSGQTVALNAIGTATTANLALRVPQLHRGHRGQPDRGAWQSTSRSTHPTTRR